MLAKLRVWQGGGAQCAIHAAPLPTTALAVQHLPKQETLSSAVKITLLMLGFYRDTETERSPHTK